jgi:hypothetical protein
MPKITLNGVNGQSDLAALADQARALPNNRRLDRVLRGSKPRVSCKLEMRSSRSWPR